MWAEGLRSSTMASLYPLPDGYPLAPHALMAALATVTGIPMDEVLNGLLIAVGVLTALTALGLLARLPAVARAAGAALVAFAYLPAAYYGQGAFKETLMALFVLAFTAVLADARTGDARRWLSAGVPAGLLAAGGVQVYSYLAVGWFAALTAAWLAAELALGGHRGVRSRARAALPAVAWAIGAAVAVFVVAVAPQADRGALLPRPLPPVTGGRPGRDRGHQPRQPRRAALALRGARRVAERGLPLRARERVPRRPARPARRAAALAGAVVALRGVRSRSSPPRRRRSPCSGWPTAASRRTWRPRRW